MSIVEETDGDGGAFRRDVRDGRASAEPVKIAWS